MLFSLLMAFLGMVMGQNYVYKPYLVQIQPSMHMPFGMGAEQQLQPLSWIPNNENRSIALPEEPNLLPHR